MCSDLAISVKHLNKTYRIFDHAGDRVKQALTFGHKQYHKTFTALRDVSFDIKKGQTVGIIGRNGSGKSTLLQLMCGILKPTSGTVHVMGRITALLELGAGFNPEFTGRENVYFQGAVIGITKAQIDARFEKIASFADIGTFMDQPVRTYSSGMFVKLAFSVAIHVEPDILVIDEALGVGDAVFMQRCFRFLNEFRKTGTLIVVSHDLQTIKSLCERVIWLKQGEVQAVGSAKSVCEGYLSDIFGGTTKNTRITRDPKQLDFVDQRLPFLNASNLRNDLRLFCFDPNGPSFGLGEARAVEVRLVSEDDQPYHWVVGGEVVTLSIEVQMDQPLKSPIIGFVVKNGSGQALFGDNTYINYLNKPLEISKGEGLRAHFRFRMPRLPIGSYSIAVAIADGSQDVNDIHHWIHDALVFESQRSSVDGSLIGLSMNEISLTTIPVVQTF